MANPQVEDGYTRIANEIMEALARVRIPGEAMQVLLTIIRKTYGFQKKEDAISLSQFSLSTGIVKPSIVRALNLLFSMNIISKNANGKVTRYGINKDFTQWKPLAKKLIVSENANDRLQKSKCYGSENATYKRKKETYTKESCSNIPGLDILKTIPGYPFDEKIDAQFLTEKAAEAPSVDIPSLLRGWKAYLLDVPLNGKSRPRAQLHNQFQAALHRGLHQKTTRTPAGPKYNMADEIDRLEREFSGEATA